MVTVTVQQVQAAALALDANGHFNALAGMDAAVADTLTADSAKKWRRLRAPPCGGRRCARAAARGHSRPGVKSCRPAAAAAGGDGNNGGDGGSTPPWSSTTAFSASPRLKGRSMLVNAGVKNGYMHDMMITHDASQPNNRNLHDASRPNNRNLHDEPDILLCKGWDDPAMHYRQTFCECSSAFCAPPPSSAMWCTLLRSLARGSSAPAWSGVGGPVRHPSGHAAG